MKVFWPNSSCGNWIFFFLPTHIPSAVSFGYVCWAQFNVAPLAPFMPVRLMRTGTNTTVNPSFPPIQPFVSSTSLMLETAAPDVLSVVYLYHLSSSRRQGDISRWEYSVGTQKVGWIRYYRKARSSRLDLASNNDFRPCCGTREHGQVSLWQEVLPAMWCAVEFLVMDGISNR